MRFRSLPVQVIPTTDGVILRRGYTEVIARGEHVGELLKTVFAASLEGRTTQEMIGRFDSSSRPVVELLIQQLIAKRFLVPVESDNSQTENRENGLDIFYWNFGLDGGKAISLLNSRRLTILGINSISRQLILALRASQTENFEIVDVPVLRNRSLFNDRGEVKHDQWPATAPASLALTEWLGKTEIGSLDCLIATSDFGGQSLLREWNSFCVQHQKVFLPVVLQDGIGKIGPLVIPGETACLECVDLRQNSHLQNVSIQRASDEVASIGQDSIGFHPSMASILGDIAAIELTKYVLGISPMMNVGTLIEMNLFATRLTVRKVLKVPRCPVCSPLLTRPSMTPRKSVFTSFDKAQT